MEKEKGLISLTIFLLKEEVTDYKLCLKNPKGIDIVKVKKSFGMDGIICTCESSKNMPKWKQYLDEYAVRTIDISDNTSNKAVMIVKISNRLMAVVFGYGRSLIKEDVIELNFGLKVALNIIDPNKMRSINATTIEDVVVTTQRQSSYSASQDEFGLNIASDIMKGVTGSPYDSFYGNTISGKDSLIASVFMHLSETKEKLEAYLKAYYNNRYKTIGFEWIDNISEVRDSLLCDELDFHLADSITKKNYKNIYAAPPEVVDWERVIGFCFSGIRKKLEDIDNYNLEIDLESYLDRFSPNINVYQKLKKDRIYAMTPEESFYPLCSVYSSIVCQTIYNKKTYILCAGSWYYINKNFYDYITKYVDSYIPLSTLNLPDCGRKMNEEDYNILAANSDMNFCLMDQKLISVEGGPKKVEACDIFTKDKQFVHVKNRSKSAQLSHLFSQGRVSAQCFISDEKFRNQVSDIISLKFGKPVFNHIDKPTTDEYEVIFVIIHSKVDKVSKVLPFFSLVNLMLTIQELDRMRMKYSIKIVKRQ